jgi:iron complex outermembrane receptor protein
MTFPLFLLSNELDTTLNDEIKWLEEETFVVSASRIKENINKTPASINIIDEDMINISGANNLLEILSTVPGIGITQSNIFVNEMEIRGIKDWFSKHILVMIDNHSLDANLLNGGATWFFSDMPLENIKRIEIIKGPASALYGANAFTALINIITKDSKDIKNAELKVKVGSYDTKASNILFGYNDKEFSISTNINIFDSDGDKIYVNQDALNNSGYTNPYKKHFSMHLKAEYKNYYLNMDHTSKKDGQHFGALGQLNDDTNIDIKYTYIEGGYIKDITSDINLKTRLYYDKYKFYNTWGIPSYSLVTVNGITNDKFGAESLATYKINNKLSTVFGAMFEKQRQDDVVTINNGIDVSNTNYTFAPSVDRDIWAGYLNTLYDFKDNIRATFGIRYDHYSDFGSNIAPRGGISWEINRSNIFKFLYGEGFRAPTFAELYSNHTVISGAANLTPEKAKTYESSFETKVINNTTIKITAFYNKFKDLITQSGTDYINSGEIITKGIELETKYDLNRGSYIMANYTYQNAKDEITDTNLPNIAKHKGNIILNYKINKYLNSFSHINIKGKTQRSSTDPRESVKGYAVLNTTLQIKNIIKNLEMKVTLNNLFDKTYYDPSNEGLIYDDYLNKGRNFLIEAKYIF